MHFTDRLINKLKCKAQLKDSDGLHLSDSPSQVEITTVYTEIQRTIKDYENKGSCTTINLQNSGTYIQKYTTEAEQMGELLHVQKYLVLHSVR